MLRLDGTYSSDAMDTPDLTEVIRTRSLHALRADGVSEADIARGRLLRR